MAYTPPLAGQQITPALLTALSGEWQPYTATLTSTTLGNGTLIARYQQGANRVLMSWILNWGSTTSGNMPVISVPVAPASLGGMRWTGSLLISRNSGNFRQGICWLYDYSTVVSTGASLTSNAAEVATNMTTAGLTMNAGGWIMGSIEYEI